MGERVGACVRWAEGTGVREGFRSSNQNQNPSPHPATSGVLRVPKDRTVKLHYKEGVEQKEEARKQKSLNVPYLLGL